MKASARKVDVSGLLYTGREIDVVEQVELPEFGTFAFAVPARAALTLRKVGGGIEVEGTVDVEATGTCARCLDDVRLPLHLVVEERVEPEAERSQTLGESELLTGSELDLTDLIRQLTDSALPIVILCGEECPGLCPTCGRKRDGSCTCPSSLE